MKKRIAALAVCLALALTACGQPKEAPATVGTIGSVDIPGGVYQLSQFSAYAEADSLTSEDNVLKAKLNMDGETVTGKAYIAAKTQEALDNALEQQAIDENNAKALILRLAAEQYDTLGNEEYETNRLRRLFSAFECVAELNADLLKSTVSEVLVTRQNVKLRLKNGQVIERSDLQ